MYLRSILIASVTESQPDLNISHRDSKIDTFKPAEPKWDAGLILPKMPYPPKSASYTVSTKNIYL